MPAEDQSNVIQASLNQELALTILPSLMIHYLIDTFGIDVTKMVELGTGSRLHQESIIVMSRKTPVKELHEFDPRLGFVDVVDAPIKVVVHREAKTLPKGLPAFACHPGFSFNEEEAYAVYDMETPSWTSTLQAFEPSHIVFSAYSNDEAHRELGWLFLQGYIPIVVQNNPLFQQEKFRFSDDSGPGWAICIARRA